MTENPFDKYKLDQPIELGGDPIANKNLFYEVAGHRMEYQTREENRTWQRENLERNAETAATYLVRVANSNSGERQIDSFKIVVNTGLIEDTGKVAGQDYSDILPFVKEHEIYEAWLSAKDGVGQTLPIKTKHQLALRRQYTVAIEFGLEDKLFEFSILSNPLTCIENYLALRSAKKKSKR